MTEKHKFNLEQWKLLIADCRQSGMRVNEWCQANGVTRDAYYYWLKQIQIESLPKALSQLHESGCGGFVDITPQSEEKTVINSACPDYPVAVLKKSDIEIEIYDSASYNLVQLLLKGIKNA